MPYRRSYALTETEILALQLHRNLHGHRTYSEDVQALVDDLSNGFADQMGSSKS
jgi:hypothetical protein